MSADTKTRKRKSGDDIVSAVKKPKTAKSAEKPTPLKSALKKSKVEAVVEQPKSKKSKSSRNAPKETIIEEVETQIEAAQEDESDGGADLTADRTAELLAGFSSSEDEADENDDGIALSKLPSAPVPKLNKKDNVADDPEATPGVVYISRIPHGFYEPQMRAYFSQFGNITHLRLARNKKTGKSQHYAFVEFDSASVAEIVAKTMDKYLLFGHILQCRVVPQEQIKDNMWKTKKGKVKNGRVKPRNRIEGAKLRKGADREVWEKRVEKEEKRRRDKAEKMKELGYEFEMPGVKSVDDVPKQNLQIESAVANDVGGVRLLEGKKVDVAPDVKEVVEKVVEVSAEEPKVVEEKIIKRKSKATGATTTTKKRKVKGT